MEGCERRRMDGLVNGCSETTNGDAAAAFPAWVSASQVAGGRYYRLHVGQSSKSIPLAAAGTAGDKYCRQVKP
jgi:hypothetical protein